MINLPEQVGRRVASELAAGRRAGVCRRAGQGREQGAAGVGDDTAGFAFGNRSRFALAASGRLLAERESVLALQESCLAAQSALSADPADDRADARSAYESTWRELRAAFTEYHRAIKDAFVDVREQVAKAWASTG